MDPVLLTLLAVGVVVYLIGVGAAFAALFILDIVLSLVNSKTPRREMIRNALIWPYWLPYLLVKQIKSAKPR